MYCEQMLSGAVSVGIHVPAELPTPDAITMIAKT
jgi:hypothetical protein